MKIRLRVEREIVEQALVEFDIDQDEYDEWLDGNPGDIEEVIEFLGAHRDWPQNIVDQIPDTTQWDEQWRDYELMVITQESEGRGA